MAGLRQQSQWVLQAQMGNSEALSCLLESIQQSLYDYIFSLVNQEHPAQDILQEVFITIVKKLLWLREPRCFRSWAYRIATRRAFRHLQQERRQRPALLEEPEQVEAPVLEETNEELLEQLPLLLGDLPPASRVVLRLHYLEEMTIQEVADVLEIPPGTVKSRLAYGLSLLRRRLVVG